MEWYVPLTILPASGILILSTTNQMMTLSSEIGTLLKNKCTPFQHNIADLKIAQLRRLTQAATLLYTAAACFALTGLLNAFIHLSMVGWLSNYVLALGVFFLMISLVLLIQYSYRTIRIRLLQHEHNHEL